MRKAKLKEQHTKSLPINTIHQANERLHYEHSNKHAEIINFEKINYPALSQILKSSEPIR